MNDIVGLLTEVFTWVGFGGGLGILVIALIASIADGTWLPARGAVERGDDGPPLVRWFDAEGRVNEAPLAASDEHLVEQGDMVDLWYQRGWIGRMRLHRGSRHVKALLGVAALLIGVGVISTVIQLVALAMAG